jgi:methylglyoxal synthase
VLDKRRNGRNTIEVRRNKKLALVADDNKKKDFSSGLSAIVNCWPSISLYATGITGQLIKCRLGLNVTRLESKPLRRDHRSSLRVSNRRRPD